MFNKKLIWGLGVILLFVSIAVAADFGTEGGLVITLDYPEESSFYTFDVNEFSIDYVYIDTENPPVTCWYNISDDFGYVDEDYMTCEIGDYFLNQPLKEGNYDLKVNMRDSALSPQYAFQEVSFKVDSLAPRVLIIDPAVSPVYLSQYFIYVNVSVDELYQKNIKFELYDNKNNLVNESLDDVIPFDTSITWNTLSDDFYTANVSVEDTVGHSTQVSIEAILDTVPPVVNIINPLGISFVNGNVLINASINDVTSGMTKIILEIDGNVKDTKKVIGNFWEYNYGWDTTLEVDGSHNTNVTSYDRAGNVGQDIIDVFVDNTPPTTIDSGIDTNWHNTNVTINLNCNDGGSGCNLTYYCYLLQKNCDPNQIYTNDITISSDGAWYGRFYSVDNVGNIESKSNFDFPVRIDKTLPIVDIGVDVETNAQILQDATASDDLSGIVNYLWTQESGAGAITFGSDNAEDTTIEADTDGNYVIRLTVTDNATNNAFDEINFMWDTTAPVTTDDYLLVGWQANDVIISLTSGVDLSGVADTLYCVDQTDTCVPNISGTSILVSDEGVNYVRYSSVDNVGNNEIINSVEVWIDKTNPVVSLTSPNNNLPFSLGTDVILNFDEIESNSDSCDLLLNDQIILGVVNGYTRNDLPYGKYEWSINCTDVSGNIGASETNTFTILADLTFPGGTNYTDLPNENDISNVNFFVENIYGRIEWVNVDLSSGENWANFIDLSQNHAEASADELNSNAEVRLYNLSWNNPRILRDGSGCSECSKKSYVNGTIIFEVDGFSVYFTDETPVPSGGHPSRSSYNPPLVIENITEEEIVVSGEVGEIVEEPKGISEVTGAVVGGGDTSILKDIITGAVLIGTAVLCIFLYRRWWAIKNKLPKR